MAPTRTPKAKQEDQPRFACPQCDSTFGRKHDVKRHEQAQKAALKIHMNKHTGKTPFVCPDCSKAYKDPSSLNHHQTRKHGHIPHHTPAWHEEQSRKNARASPYDVSAPAARGTARAKKAAAASDAASSSASSGYSSSPSSLNSNFSAPTPPPVSPSSDSSDFSSILASALSYNSSPSSSSSAGSEFSPPTPALSSTFDASDFFSFPISSVAFTDDFHDLEKDAAAFNLSNSTPGYTPQDLAMTQCPPYLVQDPTYRYKHAAQQESADYYGPQTPALSMQDYADYSDDVNSQFSYDAGAFNPAWGLPDGSASWGQQSQYSPPQPLYQDTAVFQPTPDFYDGALPQGTTYALPPFEPLGAIPTHGQYTPPAVEQPAPAFMLSELEPLVNNTVEKMPLWAKLNMTRRQQLAQFAF